MNPYSSNQRNAKERNWKILRLRGIARSIDILITDEKDRKAMLDGIDGELRRLGAHTIQEHFNRIFTFMEGEK